MSNKHIAGFVLLLTDAGVTVDPAETQNFAELPRVIIYPDPGASTRETLEGSADGQVVTIQTTCVGSTLDQAGLMLDDVRDIVEDKRPSVPGWECSRVEQLFAQPARRDDDTDPAVFYAVASWRFTAVPTTA